MLAKSKENLRWIVDEGVDEYQFCPLDKLNQQDRNLSYKLFCFTLLGYHNWPPYWIWIIGLLPFFSEKQGEYFPFFKKNKDISTVVPELPMKEESKWISVAWDVVHTQTKPSFGAQCFSGWIYQSVFELHHSISVFFFLFTRSLWIHLRCSQLAHTVTSCKQKQKLSLSG